jgi:hypothetical protein
MNEKLILLHVLFHEFKHSGLRDLSTEYFRILALCSDCLEQNDVNFANTVHTKYNYFFKGKSASTKNDKEKSEMIQEIINKIAPVKNIEKFKKILTQYKNK